MRFTPYAFLLAAAASSSSLGVSAKQSENCPPKPEPIYNIKFTDKDGDTFHNYELHGTARIVEPAPEPVTRALRIDQIYSYALLKDVDISPSQMQDVTLAIGVYIEKIRPMHPDGKKLGVTETLAHGWVMGHDNGGYDRAIFLHDERFNGLGLSPGYEFPANNEWIRPATNQWLQIVAIWRQGGECELFHDKIKVPFSQEVIGANNDGLPNISIGSLEQRRYGAVNDNDVWIKDVQVFDWALSQDELNALDCDFTNDLVPSIDCGDGGPLVESCTDCAEGGRAIGCKGDCVWDINLPICKENDGPKVDCGDHDASDCAQCDATADNTSGCAGECKWDIASDSCQAEDYEPPQVCNPVNIALSKNGGLATQSSTWVDQYSPPGTAMLAIDGISTGGFRDGHMSHTLSEPSPSWWQVKFLKNPIMEVRVKGTWKEDRILNFIMEIWNGENKVYDSSVSAPKESSEIKSWYSYTIPGIVGDRVKITLPGQKYLQLAEVEVLSDDCHASLDEAPGCAWRNVALSKNGGKARQVSTWVDSLSPPGDANLAIDDNREVNFRKGHSSHTLAAYNPTWWMVEFPRAKIWDVQIYNAGGTRSLNLVMEIYNGEQKVYNSKVSASRMSATNKKVYHYSIPNVVGTKVYIYLPAAQYLQLAEVEVWGERCTL